MTLAVVSNRFPISKSCPAIPWKVRVGACYPLPSHLPFEVSDIWFQLWGAPQFNGQLPRNAQHKHSGHRGWLLFPGCQSHTQPSCGLAVPVDLMSPPTSLPILLPNVSRSCSSSKPHGFLAFHMAVCVCASSSVHDFIRAPKGYQEK